MPDSKFRLHEYQSNVDIFHQHRQGEAMNTYIMNELKKIKMMLLSNEQPSFEAIVHENSYKRLSANELRDALEWKSGIRSYEDWIKAFCERKYNSEFSLEMSRSVREYLEQYDN